jgi:hypothetical protein
VAASALALAIIGETCPEATSPTRQTTRMAAAIGL